MTDDAMSRCATAPLVEILERVPRDARMSYEHSSTSHSNIPVGRLAHEAAAELKAKDERIAKLEAELFEWQMVAAQQGHPTPCNLGPLCPYCEIDRQRYRLQTGAAAWQNYCNAKCGTDAREAGQELTAALEGQVSAVEGQVTMTRAPIYHAPEHMGPVPTRSITMEEMREIYPDPVGAASDAIYQASSALAEEAKK